MARLEYVDFRPWREVPVDDGFVWEPDKLAPEIKGLPQIFWESGEGWAEANHWAVDKIVSDCVHLDTAKGLMKQLHAYSSFLELHELDWRHFPTRLSERAAVQFRGHLIKQIEQGSLQSSTARSRISAIVQFYRHAATRDFINR